ncbi:M56 family metallopeptidase [Pontibacter ruber]|uniref:M56 family metallopeptidase n=1 Tax=Pontibacter ruber TaxID=1343895 RepID=A0ABW5CUM3_9BACT|nr:M56 family metallopeptidase [Pontibacter ruber]
MPALILYLLKVNVALVLFCLAYHLVLRKLTFYTLNRVFLVFGIVFSTLYPLFDLSELFNQHQELAAIQTYAIPITAWNATPPIPEQAPAFDYWQIPVLLFWVGAAVMAARLLLQFVSLYQIHRASLPAKHHGVAFRKVQGVSEAFSFWQTIYLAPDQHKASELESILRHEQVHVRGWHTLDVLLTELSTVFYWFNPGAWLMKKAVKENLEFIADQHVVNAGVDRVAYQYLLLKVVGATQPQIANQFNFPSLKRRIAMMNKKPTHKASKLRLLIAVPLAAILLLAFRSATQGSGLVTEDKFSSASATSTPVNVQADDSKAYIFSIEDEPYYKNNLPADYKAFLKRNPAIRKLGWKFEDRINFNLKSVVILLKNGKVETYDFDQNQRIPALEAKYGQLPNLPAPPPPVPAKEQLPPPPVVDHSRSLNKAFYERNPNVTGLAWLSTDKMGAEQKITGFVIKLKNGEMERYNYNDRESISTYKKKYGDLPVVPESPELPPPPVQNKTEAKTSLPDSAVYYIDGKEVTAEAAKKLDPKEIHSVNVLKGEGAKKAFGDKAEKGVISITTKKNKDTPEVLKFNKKLTAPQPNGQGAIQLSDEYKAFYARNPQVRKIEWIAANEIRIRLESEEEVYNLNDKRSRAAAEKKYGQLPSSPPPARVMTQEEFDAQVKKGPQENDEIFIPEEIDYYKDRSNLPVDYTNFLKKNPSVKKVGWTMNKQTKSEVIVLFMKSGGTERYELNNSQSMAIAEGKYGKFPTVLPPPPPVMIKKN